MPSSTGKQKIVSEFFAGSRYRIATSCMQGAVSYARQTHGSALAPIDIALVHVHDGPPGLWQKRTGLFSDVSISSTRYPPNEHQQAIEASPNTERGCRVRSVRPPRQPRVIQTLSRGCLSLSETWTSTFSPEKPVSLSPALSFSANVGRYPRSVLVWPHNTTYRPLATAASTSCCKAVW
jgi:hypothetical protein